MKRKKYFIILLAASLAAVPFTVSATEEGVQYVHGRELTEEEIEEQKALETVLPEIQELPEGYEPVSRVARTRLPAKYDAREEGLITPVKDQGDWGSCWAFATIAATESDAILKGYDSNPDFSELHLAYFYYNRVTDPLNNTEGDKNIASDYYLNNGGDPGSAALELAGWTGIADETVAPYLPYDQPDDLDEEKADDVAFALENTKFLSTDRTEMKQAILDNGSITIGYLHDNTYMNYNTAAYCYPEEVGTNHAVNIIGWDDDYSASNFLPESNVTENGAWIVKNSWSNQWGDEGYFYLSYEDSNISSPCAFDIGKKKNGEYKYYYDGSALPAYITVSSGTSVCNTYEIQGNTDTNQQLDKIQFVTYTPEIDYKVEIYKNPENARNPEGGFALLTEPLEGTTGNAGLYTVELDEKPVLNVGDQLSVVITFSGKEEIGVGIEKGVDTGAVVFQAALSPSQSVYLEEYERHLGDGLNFWNDLYEWDACFRIRAITTDTTADQTKINVGTLTGLKAKAAGKNRVQLSWDYMNRVDGYLVYGMKDGKYGYVGMTTQNLSFTDKNALDTDYNFYWVFPYVKDSTGKMITGKCEKYVYAKGVCTAVTELRAQSVKNGVKLSWNPSAGAEGYLVYGIRGTGKYGYVGMTSGTTYTDKKALSSDYNYYWVFPYHKTSEGKMVVGETGKYTYGRAR